MGARSGKLFALPVDQQIESVSREVARHQTHRTDLPVQLVVEAAVVLDLLRALGPNGLQIGLDGRPGQVDQIGRAIGLGRGRKHGVGIDQTRIAEHADLGGAQNVTDPQSRIGTRDKAMIVGERRADRTRPPPRPPVERQEAHGFAAATDHRDTRVFANLSNGLCELRPQKRIAKALRRSGKAAPQRRVGGAQKARMDGLDVQHVHLSYSDAG